MVDRQPVRDPATTVMADQTKTCVAERLHQRHHVGRHHALAVARVGGVAFGFGRVAITAQVGHHQKEAVFQCQRHTVPDGMCLREAVQEQQRWAIGLAAGARKQTLAVDLVKLCLEPFEPSHRAPPGHDLGMWMPLSA